MKLAPPLSCLVAATALSTPALARDIPLLRGQADQILSASVPLPDASVAAPASPADPHATVLPDPAAAPSPAPVPSPLPQTSAPVTVSTAPVLTYPSSADAFVLGTSAYTTADGLLAADGGLVALGGYHDTGSVRGTFTLFSGAVRARDVPFTWTAFGAGVDLYGSAARLTLDASGLAGYRDADAPPFVALTTSWDGAAGSIAGVRSTGSCRGVATIDDDLVFTSEAFGCRSDLSGLVRLDLPDVALDLFAGGGVHADRSLFGSQEVPGYFTSGLALNLEHTRLSAAFYVGDEVGGRVRAVQELPYVHFFAEADGFLHNASGVTGVRGRAGVTFSIPPQ